MAAFHTVRATRKQRAVHRRETTACSALLAEGQLVSLPGKTSSWNIELTRNRLMEKGRVDGEPDYGHPMPASERTQGRSLKSI